SAETHREHLWSELDQAQWRVLIERLTIVLSSQYIAQILVPRPGLASALMHGPASFQREQYIEFLRASIDAVESSSAKSDALRRAWYDQIIGIGYRDMMSLVEIDAGRGDADARATAMRESVRESNRAQTGLAEAALLRAVEIAFESCGLEQAAAAGLRFTVMGLGRLGHAGMDYGSDLDLLIVFDDSATWPPRELTQTGPAEPLAASAGEFYSKFTSQLVNVLSLITREGMIYRVDLRLRPEGKSGPLARGLSSLLGYIESRASAWEHSAYVKTRA